MIATILTIIAYILPLIVEGVKGQREKSKGNDHDENIQEFRKGLNAPSLPLFKKVGDGVDAALADQHDRVLEALCGSERGGEGNYHEGVVG